MASDKRDCQDKYCEMSYELLPDCTLYLPIDESYACDYPCSEKNCKTEFYHFESCPSWSCTSKTTPSPLDPTPTPDHGHLNCTGPVCIASVTIASVLLILVIVSLAVLVFLKKTDRIHFGHQISYDRNRATVEMGDVLAEAHARELDPLLGGEAEQRQYQEVQQENNDPLQAAIERDAFHDVILN